MPFSSVVVENDSRVVIAVLLYAFQGNIISPQRMYFRIVSVVIRNACLAVVEDG